MKISINLNLGEKRRKHMEDNYGLLIILKDKGNRNKVHGMGMI